MSERTTIAGNTRQIQNDPESRLTRAARLPSMPTMDVVLRSVAIREPAEAPGAHRYVRLLVARPGADRRQGDASSGSWSEGFTARELEILRFEHVAERRTRHRVLGRLAVKDVVRDLARESGGPALERTDVEVLSRPGGRPFVVLRPGPAIPRICVSISHTGGLAAALGCRGSSVLGVGIDIEPLASAGVIMRTGLTLDEREALDRLPSAARAHQAVSLWCAKEAAVKAWGTGFAEVGGPRLVHAAPPDGGPPGEITVRAPGRPDLAALTVRMVLHGHVVLGTTVWAGPKDCKPERSWRTLAPTTPQQDEECHA